MRVPGETLIGGDGNDTADYSRRNAPLTIELDNVANDGEAGEADDVQADVEGVIGGSDADALTGNDAPNVLDGQGGDDRIQGLNGDDTLDGGDNEDSVSGGGGVDTITGASGEDKVTGGDGDDSLSAGSGSDTADGGDGTDTIQGGAGSDSLAGGAGNDRLNGGASGLVGADGDDRLNGGDGADVLLGADGDDRLDGGLGPDVMNGEDGRDTVTYEDRADEIFVTLDGEPNDGQRDEGDNVATDVEVVLGGTLFNTLTGDSSRNTLTGASEEDLIDGRRGEDRQYGGGAEDVLLGRDGSTDTVDCGDGMDLAIVDRVDSTRDCEWIDRPGERRAAYAKKALVRPTRSFGLRLPSAFRNVTLTDDVSVPLGSRIDPQQRGVRLLVATEDDTARQRISVRGSPFTLRQQGRRKPSTVLRMAGGVPDACEGPASPGTVPRTKRMLRDTGRRQARGRRRREVRPRGRREAQANEGQGQGQLRDRRSRGHRMGDVRPL